MQKFNGESFYLAGRYYQRSKKRLHRVVWEYHYGKIPEGFDIHHKDGNPGNNQIDNLELLLRREHHQKHMLKPERVEKSRQSICIAREEAKKWHGSIDGAAWHSEHAKEYWSKTKENTYRCSFCGKEFHTNHVYGDQQNRFCSNSCKTAYRVRSGVDNVERTCPVCGNTFVTGKYTKQICCGYECARKRRWGK